MKVKEKKDRSCLEERRHNGVLNVKEVEWERGCERRKSCKRKKSYNCYKNIM